MSREKTVQTSEQKAQQCAELAHITPMRLRYMQTEQSHIIPFWLDCRSIFRGHRQWRPGGGGRVSCGRVSCVVYRLLYCSR